MLRRERVKPVSKFVIYFEENNLVGRGWEMQEGLAVEPLLLGCGVKPHDLKRLRHQPKQINPGCPINLFLRGKNTSPNKLILGVQLTSFDLTFALIPTFARLLKNKRQMRNDAMDGDIRLVASGTR